MAATSTVKTRILIISDTHKSVPKLSDPAEDIGHEIAQIDQHRSTAVTGFRHPLPKADVVLHCGDLTSRGFTDEVQGAFDMLRTLDAPLKLVIAGNHDLCLDPNFVRGKFGGYDQADHMIKEARQMVEDGRADGIQLLDEGVHTFDLANGARLKVFASPYTPSFGIWAFQYDAGQHEFRIPDDVDVVMTHGPPHRVLDEARLSNSNAGCPELFKAIALARPKIHCFGHIHEAWGGYLARWKGDAGQRQSRLSRILSLGRGGKENPLESAIEPSESALINLGMLMPYSDDTEEVRKEKIEELVKHSKQRAMMIDLTEGDWQLKDKEQTMFINAAIMSMGYRPSQLPWLIDVDLPVSQSN